MHCERKLELLEDYMQLWINALIYNIKNNIVFWEIYSEFGMLIERKQSTIITFEEFCKDHEK